MYSSISCAHGHASFMATCMFSLGALGAWPPENKAALVARIGTNCGESMVGPNGEPISEWDVSRVTDMSKVFKDCSNFNGDISGWNTSQVTTFRVSARVYKQGYGFDV